jgi:hypothetical protein
MAKNIDNFRDELIKIAKAVEILEDSFIGDNRIEVNIPVDDKTFNTITNYLGGIDNQNKCIVSIGNSEFIFLKK